ncbi:MAG: adenylyltransferase/cytidyltransferase family protein [Parachlamydiaceae bacterium]|nr:adenylyltransferase/cytidyltransferase family protein [Parachlamydiaceae bacterium]
MKKWSDDYQKKIIEPNELSNKIAQFKAQGLTIGTLNGSFDLLHAGHLQIIYEASQVADLLIVALNTDSSIQRYKNIKRPIIPLQYRLQMMCSLAFVDYVTWFDETDPKALLEIIRPHVHVNGAEYGHECLEADTVIEHGGAVHIVNLVPGLSTTSILNKIASL